jgi:carbon-monoxide dehydrogenase medium subunit
LKPAPFAYADPDTVAEALELLAAYGDAAKVLAGGQSLVPLMNFRLARPAVLVDINRLDGLDAISEEPAGSLIIGAMVRQRQLERWSAEKPAWKMLHKALAMIGHAGIRARGTIGGSLAHADPAAELPAVLLVHDGVVVARRGQTTRTIPARELLRGPLSTSLQADELLVNVRLAALPSQAGWAFDEVARRQGDFALVGVAATLTSDAEGRVADARLALFGVGDTAVRVDAAETWLRGRTLNQAAVAEAARMAAAPLEPQTDLQATGAYRKRVAEVLVKRALTQAGRL